MKCIIIILLMILLTGCGAMAPEIIQDYSAAYSPDGKTTYSVNGYTKPNEIKKTDAEKHAQAFATGICAEKGFTGLIQRIDTRKMKSGPWDLLYWQAIIVCEE